MANQECVFCFHDSVVWLIIAQIGHKTLGNMYLYNIKTRNQLNYNKPGASIKGSSF